MTIKGPPERPPARLVEGRGRSGKYVRAVALPGSGLLGRRMDLSEVERLSISLPLRPWRGIPRGGPRRVHGE